MNLAVISIIINLLVSLSIPLNEDLPEGLRFIFLIVMLVFVGLSVVGLIAYSKTKKKAFGILAIVGFALFVPIGLIGAVGMRKIMDKEEKKIFMQAKDQING